MNFKLLLYHIFLSLYKLAITIASVKNTKANAMLLGRKNLIETIKKNHLQHSNTIWLHCASVGEYEQGLPIVQALKNKLNCRIVLTFFSSSGVNAFKKNSVIDEMYYLPFDNKKNAEQFLDIIKPTIAIFIKYELWYYYLHALKNKNIKTYLACMYLQPKNIFTKWYGAFHLQMLQCFTKIFVQDGDTLQQLQTLGFDNVIVTGDTRFDRMKEIVNTNFNDEKIEAFCKNKKIIIAGSTWQADEKILTYWWNTNLQTEYKLIIAPHQLEPNHLQQIEKLFINDITIYTKNNFDSDKKIMLLDTMGLLNKIYRYATIVYIGGGFGAGIHNIVEPLSYLKPVLIGPNYQRFLEAKQFLNLNVTFEIKNNLDIENKITYIENNYINIQEKIKIKINDSIGAVGKIVDELDCTI